MTPTWKHVEEGILRDRLERAWRKKTRNPLTIVIIGFAIGDAYDLWHAYDTGIVEVFTATAWLLSVALFILYFKKSKHAGSFMFYAFLPIFPIYFGLKAIGLNPPPATTETYVFALGIWMAANVAVWKLKRNYDRYVVAMERPSPLAECSN